MYDVIIDVKAMDALQKLQKKIQRRIIDKIISTQSNPFHFFTRLSGRKEYRMRVGDYRIISDINDRKIIILLIGHRKKIYKEL